MNYLDLSIEELHALLVNKTVTPLMLAKEAIELAKKDTNNAFETILEKEALEYAATLTEVEEDNIFDAVNNVKNILKEEAEDGITEV